MTSGPTGPRPGVTPGRTGDLAHLARAVGLAERGRHSVRPNPLVGCVLVRDGHVVGEGWHERPGGPHAEIVALDAARERGEPVDGATAYITLEPCAHRGRTGPCSAALIEAGVARVVYGLADPDPEAGGGHAALEQAGVEVAGGLLAGWVAAQNEVFVTNVTRRRPHVVLKLAQTVDGALRAPGWITGPRARRAVHRLRARVDGVVVGSGTVLADDPRLDVRHVDAPGGQPRPVVLDARGRTGAGAAVARDGAVVVTTARSGEGWRDTLRRAGVRVLEVAPDPEGHVSVPHALPALAAEGLHALLLEGGGRLAASFVRERLVDRLVLHVAVAASGAVGLPRVAPCAQPRGGWSWATRRSGWHGPDLEVVAAPSRDGPPDT